MKLKYYPDAIALATEAVNTLDLRLGTLRQEIARLEGKAEVIVAFETNLKNEDQRKARKFQILEENSAYSHLQDSLIQLTTERANNVAQLERLRDQFSVAKLEARLAIAEKLALLETRQLVGL